MEVGKHIYKAVFEFKNGMVGTWEDYSYDLDEFITDLCHRKSNIKKFIKIYEKIEYPNYVEKQKRVKKYNEFLKEAR